MDKSGGGEAKLVMGLAIGSAFTRAATALISCPTASGAGMGDKGSNLVLMRPEIVVNADGDRAIPTLVALRKEEEGGKEGEWLVGVRE
jgi:hypothetical protein